MSEVTSRNVYVEHSGELNTEIERLRSFDLPTATSIDAIGTIQPNTTVLDIGSGENPSLNNYIQGKNGYYIAFDTRHSAVVEQSHHGSAAVQGDARFLPFANNAVGVAHARFVLGHFRPEDRKQAANETLQCVKPGGEAVFIDYDWTAIDGSPAMIALRDFTLSNIKVFDAAYGSYSLEELSAMGGNQVTTKEVRTKSPQLFDYKPVLGLRQITLKGLELANASEELVDQANSIFDALELEASMKKPPGFTMPDIVAVVLTKSELK